MNYKDALRPIIQEVSKKQKRNGLTFLTGAGLSAESGIPTYRGSDGIWVKGTKYHKPEEFGTWAYFCENQEEVWQFTLFKKGMVENAIPNKSHDTIAAIEENIPERFQLITQNVDGLHQRAGSKNIFEIHGNYRQVRCSGDCDTVLDFPSNIPTKEYLEDLTSVDLENLKCPNCGEWYRPNVLWFDEYYNERLFKLDSARKAAKNSGILFVLGTSGATNLPIMLAQTTLKYGGYVVDINLEDNHFTELIRKNKRKVIIRDKTSNVLPVIEALIAEFS